MSIKDDKKEEKDKAEIDFGIGKISFGGLFKGIGSVIDLVSKMEEEGKGEVRREGGFTSPSGRVKGVYGFSIKTGLGGKPTVEPFGNVKKTAKGPTVSEEREPIVDIFDEKEEVRIIVEVPGVAEESIKTEIKGDVLTLEAKDTDRKYYKEVVLPKNVDAGTLKSKYKNGVLEIRIDKK